MKNSIAERIANFLSGYLPFSQLPYDDLIRIALTIRVVNLDKNKILFQINDELHDCFYVVASGMINLTVISDAEEILINHCVEGDLFGLRPFFAKNNYQVSSKAQEDTILYAIPISTFKPIVANNTEILDYLLQSFANTNQTSSNDGKRKLIKDTVQIDSQSEVHFFQSLNYNTSPLLALPSETVQSIAQTMSDNLSSCTIIHENNFPVGLITDVDLRTKIATGKFYVTTLASSIMNTNFTVVPENISLAEAQLIMINNNATHLCVTEDGTSKTKIEGVISQKNLIASQSNNPGVLVKEIKKAMSSDELNHLKNKLLLFVKTSIEKKIPLSHICNITGEINGAIIKRAYSLAILELGSAPVRYAVMSMGSQGRKEQLLTTDYDSYLVFEDVPSDKYKEVKDYFIKLSTVAYSILNKAGFELCVHGHMASNIVWCNSLTEWINQYNNWINTPGEKTSNIAGIFFDFDFAYGNKEIEESLEDHIFKTLPNKKKFFAYLGSEALKNPHPLNFFKQFNDEEEGDKKDFFDIKSKALNYYVDVARVLTLSHNIKGINNTFLRFKQLAITELKYSEIYLEAAETYHTLLKFRVDEGLENNNNGRYLDLEEMSKIDKEKLKNCFLPMKELEDIVKNKFQLTFFS
jgi:CBS domain-containing protein